MLLTNKLRTARVDWRERREQVRQGDPRGADILLRIVGFLLVVWVAAVVHYWLGYHNRDGQKIFATVLPFIYLISSGLVLPGWVARRLHIQRASTGSAVLICGLVGLLWGLSWAAQWFAYMAWLP